MNLQNEFLDAFFSQTRSFFLTGGSALNLFYFHHRVSEDLDCFATSPEEFSLVNGIIRTVCEKIGATYNSKQDFPDFKRYLVSRDNETIVVDCVNERVPQIFPQKNVFGNVRVDLPEEMVVNKLCALLGRIEYKDLIDLYTLNANGYESLKYLEISKRKDGGMAPSSLAYALSCLNIDDMPDSFSEVVPREKLKEFQNKLIDELLKGSFLGIQKS